MKKKYLLLLAAIAVIAACVFVFVVVVLPTRSGVTKANFDQIEKGMSRADIVEIFGEHQPSTGGTELLHVDAYDDLILWLKYGRHDTLEGSFEFWSAADGSTASVWFSRDRVLGKKWYPSPYTFWDTLRRWVGLN
jgi:hypothetical protein